MLITVFGANGATGRHVVEEALERGHEVHAVVRNPESLDIRHERLAVVRGDVLDPSTMNIVQAMKRAGVKRVVSISAAPLGDGTSAFQRFLYGMLWRFFRELYEDLRRMESVLRDGEVDWTVMRPPRLTNGPHTKKFRTAIDHNVGNTISRSDLASEMLRVLADPQTVRRTVGIGY